jgi:hypothetical protein
MACPLPIYKGWRMGSWAWCLLGAGVVKKEKKERDNNYSSTWEGRTRKKEKRRGMQ